jgi:hypothetical protein
MTRFQVALMICGICAIGYVYLRFAHKGLQKRMRQTADFLSHLHVFLQTRSVDSDNYSWLLRHSYEMQANMGDLGIMGQFHAAYSREVIHNWPIVINSLPAMRRSLSRDFGSEQEFDEYGALVQEAILRYIGPLESEVRESRDRLRNPVIWFRYGVQWLLLSPFIVLRWLGLHRIPEQTALGANPVFRFLAASASVITLLSSLVTIIVGWDRVVPFLESLFRHFHT